MSYFKLSKTKTKTEIEDLNGYDENLLEEHLHTGRPEAGTMNANGTMINSSEYEKCFETDGYIIGKRDQLTDIVRKRF